MRFSGNLLYRSAVSDGAWGILPDKALFFPVRWRTRTYSHQIRTYLNLSFRKKWMFRHTPERLPAKKKKTDRIPPSSLLYKIHTSKDSVDSVCSFHSNIF